MINELKQINQNNFLQFIKYCETELRNKNGLGVEEFNNNYGTSFIKPINKELFTRIVIQGSTKFIESVTFFGNFDLDFSEVIQLLGQYRSFYVAHDDRYEYLFNENSSLGNFVVKTFSENDANAVHSWPIQNIQVRW